MRLGVEISQSESQHLNLMRYKQKTQMHFRNSWMLWIFLLFLLHGNAYSSDDNILTKPEQWLGNLSQGDQKIALVLYLIRLGEKSNDVLSNAKSVKDKLWSTKILMCGHALSARFATKNKDQQEAMTFAADSLSDVISGKGTVENRKSNLDKAFLENQKIANSITNDAAASFKKRHAFDSENINKSLTVAAMLCASADVIKKEQSACRPKGTDVCKIARKMADEMAFLLPMRLNSNLVIQTVFSVKNSIIMTAKLEYSKSHLENALSSFGMNNDDMLKIMQNHARDGFCQPNTPNKSFIDLGGVVEYHYRFNDGSMYTQQRIDSCL